MIRPPSLQRTYDDFFTLDPAFIQRPADLPADASDDEKAAHKSAVEDYEAKIAAAKETGKWEAVLVPGAVPTKFVVGQVDRNIWRAILDRTWLPPDSPRYIGQAALVALLFRLAIQNITGFEVKVDRRPDPKWDGWEMASADIITTLDSIDIRIVGQIGTGVYGRLMEVSGKS